MTGTEALNKARDFYLRRQTLSLEVEQMETRLMGTCSPDFSQDVVQGGIAGTVYDIIDYDMIDKVRASIQEVDILTECYDQIKEKIDVVLLKEIDDPMWVEILEQAYLKGKTLDVIASDFHMPKDVVRRMKDRALNFFNTVYAEAHGVAHAHKYSSVGAYARVRDGSDAPTSATIHETGQIAEVLAEARVARGVTQRQLSMKTGIDQANISRIEKGNVAPSLQTLQRIAQALDLDLSIILMEKPSAMP